MDRIRSRIPGLSETLAPRRDIFGRPVQGEGGLGPDMVTPIWTMTARNDPTIKALLYADIGISPPARKVRGRELTPAEYSAYSETIGSIAKPQLDALVATSVWDRMAGDDREEAVDRIMRAARKEARDQIGVAPKADNDAGVPPPPPGYSIAS